MAYAGTAVTRATNSESTTVNGQAAARAAAAAGRAPENRLVLRFSNAIFGSGEHDESGSHVLHRGVHGRYRYRQCVLSDWALPEIHARIPRRDLRKLGQGEHEQNQKAHKTRKRTMHEQYTNPYSHLYAHKSEQLATLTLSDYNERTSGTRGKRGPFSATLSSTRAGRHLRCFAGATWTRSGGHLREPVYSAMDTQNSSSC